MHDIFATPIHLQYVCLVRNFNGPVNTILVISSSSVYLTTLPWQAYTISVYQCSAYSYARMPASVAQFDAPSDCRPGGRGFNPRRGRQHSFVEIDHEIFSTVILSLPLIQEGQLSVSGERMCTILVNRLED